MTNIEISACLVVKNDEAYLEGCLRSLSGIADEIIVVDRGSADRTVAIAGDHKARIFNCVSEDNSRVRNESLRRARGRWILVIDADERVRPVDRSYLESLMNDASKIAYYCGIFIEPGWTAMNGIRFFRNDPKIRYRHYFHAHLQETLSDLTAARGQEIGQGAIYFDHLGYAGDARDRCRRNLRLLIKELDSEGESLIPLRHLALMYIQLGRKKQAKITMQKCIAMIRKKGEHHPRESGPYVDLISVLLKDGGDVSALLAEAMKAFPENPSLYWLQGKWLIEKGSYEDAIPYFERLTAWGENQDYTKFIAHRAEIFDKEAYDSLATCYFKLKRYSRARTCYEKALESDPDNEEFKIKMWLSQNLAGRKDC